MGNAVSDAIMSANKLAFRITGPQSDPVEFIQSDFDRIKQRYFSSTERPFDEWWALQFEARETLPEDQARWVIHQIEYYAGVPPDMWWDNEKYRAAAEAAGVSLSIPPTTEELNQALRPYYQVQEILQKLRERPPSEMDKTLLWEYYAKVSGAKGAVWLTAGAILYAMYKLKPK